jgi:hypothetical protein
MINVRFNAEQTRAAFTLSDQRQHRHRRDGERAAPA